MTTEGTLAEAVVSYQNQTAQDIESGRSRINSVGSYASNHSDDALLPEVHVIKKANGVTSAAPENVRLYPISMLLRQCLFDWCCQIPETIRNLKRPIGRGFLIEILFRPQRAPYYFAYYRS